MFPLLRRKRPHGCPATTGTAFNIGGRTHFPCELSRGHEGSHEREGAPLRARWTESGGVRVFEYAATR